MKKKLELFKTPWIPWLVASIVLILCIGVIIFPKTIYFSNQSNSSVTTCSCFGSSFSFGTKCVGFSYDCKEEAKTMSERTCPRRTCDELVDTFSVISSQQTFQAVQESKRGTDVILIIDTSNSMEGGKIAAAKQAAISLVQNIEESERIAIITFNEDAAVVQDFSSDKAQITSAIENISLSGGTKYLPALITAGELLSSQVKISKKGIIFLSDGVPADDPDKIIKETRSLQKKGIVLFTISFGIDVDENENILSLMSPYRKDEREEGWYQSFRGSEDITQAFFEAWQDIKKIPIISIDSNINQETYSTNKSKEIGFMLSVDDTRITQKPFPDALCIPQVSLDVSFLNKETNESYLQKLSTNNHIFYLEENLLPGNYSVKVDAYINQEDSLDCVFVGEKKIDNLLITKEERCVQSSCKETIGLLEDFSLVFDSGSYLPRKDGSAKVAIVVDRSESISRYARQVLEGVHFLNSLLSPHDERSLIIFSEEAHMIVPFTTDIQDIATILKTGTNGDLNPQGTTRMLPVLKKVHYLFVNEESSKNDKKNILVLLTDGMPYDKEGFSEIESKAKDLIDNGVCTYIFSYGENILDNKEISVLFRSIGKYSESKLSCGGYLYSPSDKEISSVIKHMFGAQKNLKILDETSITLTNSYEVLEDSSVEITARIVSSLTGVTLPFEQKFSEFVCVDKPALSASLLHKEDLFPLLVEEQNNVYKILSEPLLPGRYSLLLNASLQSQDCLMSDSVKQDIIVLGSDSERAEIFVLLLLVIFLFLLFSSLQLMKKSLIKKPIKEKAKVKEKVRVNQISETDKK